MSIINQIQNFGIEDYNVDYSKPIVGYVLGEDDWSDEEYGRCC